MQQFVNSFRCNKHDHCSALGASCSVDSLLELYFFCIFYNVDLIEPENALLKCLNKACLERIRGGDLCLIRLPVWNWCVENLPEAFHPMGRNDAEILVAFQFLCQHPFFLPIRKSAVPCNDCTVQMPLPVTLTSLGNTRGYLPDAIIYEIAQAQCRSCSPYFTVDNITLPPVLTVELGIVQFRNRQNPPVIIPENIHLVGVSYTLTGAVLVRPDHFFCIAKVGNMFCVFDDLSDEVRQFLTFTAAVTGDCRQMEKQHITTDHVHGIHIFIYVKSLSLRSSSR